ncbi:MAG TPA: class I SAM-dependent methyltransferase [Allosphingosinicella sp.]|nr:class I SAM-dependent methyltransferase [Allosphingosinicella sp.]
MIATVAEAAAAELFERPLPLVDGVYLAETAVGEDYAANTAGAFSDKWASTEGEEEGSGWQRFQLRWYLDCYGYESEAELAASLAGRRWILDAGCGPGHKAAWLARLAPAATIVAMDLSDAIFIAARRHAGAGNMLFVKGDIAATPFRDGAFDFINCDQVLHHTADPPLTLAEFRRILAPGGALNTYVYARKALPRELLDEYFRDYSRRLSRDELWALSEQLTRLGRTLAELEATIDVPAMPALGIAGGRMDLQRFLYWNFIKCFWNPEHGFEGSRLVNFDWYSPEAALRYSRDEFRAMVAAAGFTEQFLHSEEACHSGRFAG